jgi:hypothetical protein
MKLAARLIVPLILLIILVGILFHFRDLKGTFATSGLSVGICQANNQIAGGDRAQINSTALEFMELFARAPLAAHQQMSRSGRAATLERASVENAQASYNATETVGAPAVTETYLLRFLSGSETGLRVPCSFHGGRAVFVSRGGAPASAVVLIAEELSGSSQRTTSVWLEHEDGEWRVRAINFGFSRIVGRDSEQLWEAARQQRARGHLFNAALLYVAAQSASYRGAFYQSRMMQDFNTDYGTFAAPEMLRGTPPFRWTLNGETFQVSQVHYNGFGSGDVGLVITQSSSPWTESTEAEAINRRLIDAFVVGIPEWNETFDAIIVRAPGTASNEVWGTVYTRTTGYSDPPDSDQRYQEP